MYTCQNATLLEITCHGSYKPTIIFIRHVQTEQTEIRFYRLCTGRNSYRCFCVELVKLLLVPRYSVDIFHILVLQEYWVVTENRIPLKLMLGGMKIVALSISSHEQTQ